MIYDFQTIFGIAPNDASDLWFWGFGSVLFCYALGWVLRVCVQLIRSL